MHIHTDASRPDPDPILTRIADYVLDDCAVISDEARETARYCLMDSLGCAMLALQHPQCVRLLGPVIPDVEIAGTGGVRVPGTRYRLDPVQAAFNMGCMIRWLDFNDTWLAAEWGHPSDNLGAILACAQYASQRAGASWQLTGRDILTAMIKAYEIQGVIALENAFNRFGIDHVILVRIASTAVATALLGGSRQQVINAVSNAWIDGGALRTYRHAPNTGSRKSWAAGDATSRATWHALMALRGEMGYPSALTAPTWGVHDVLLHGSPLQVAVPFRSYVMEHVLFKVSFPAEFHAQTAVEAAIQLHSQVLPRIGQIEKIQIHTQESAMRIINKIGPLNNYADRDHCLQYMVAVPLLYGDLIAAHYQDEVARNPSIDELRNKMEVVEDPRYSREYLDSEKRSIANAIQVFFKDGSSTDKIEIEYPIGHRRRRREAIPLLIRKFDQAIRTRFNDEQSQILLNCYSEAKAFEHWSIVDLVDMTMVM